MTRQEIKDYCFNNSNSTNKMVLSSLLDQWQRSKNKTAYSKINELDEILSGRKVLEAETK